MKPDVYMLYTSCIHGEYMYQVVCTMYRLWRDVYQYDNVNTYNVYTPLHGVQSINAV